jgi:hypothetical protein
MARAPVSKFGFGHPAQFYHVPFSQCFRALNALSMPPLCRPVPSRPIQLGSKNGSKLFPGLFRPQSRPSRPLI